MPERERRDQPALGPSSQPTAGLSGEEVQDQAGGLMRGPSGKVQQQEDAAAKQARREEASEES